MARAYVAVRSAPSVRTRHVIGGWGSGERVWVIRPMGRDQVGYVTWFERETCVLCACAVLLLNHLPVASKVTDAPKLFPNEMENGRRPGVMSATVPPENLCF